MAPPIHKVGDTISMVLPTSHSSRVSSIPKETANDADRDDIGQHPRFVPSGAPAWNDVQNISTKQCLIGLFERPQSGVHFHPVFGKDGGFEVIADIPPRKR
jgi:hypothetical protein